MKRILIVLCVQAVIFLHSSVVYSDALDLVLSLQSDNFEHVTFSRIKSNRHSFNDEQLKIEVDSSASFLMKAFANVEQVKQVHFKWRSEGVPTIDDARHEEQRTGDDAVFKVGLLLSGGDASINPFLPPWMKRVEKSLNHPSENMLYMVANTKHQSGAQWPNPYNKKVTMIAMDSVVNEQGWRESSYVFEGPVNVVALWLMADGDDTGSSFTVYVKDLSLE